MSIRLFVFLFLLSGTLPSCFTSPKPDMSGVSITIYGLDDCGYCGELKEELDDEGIPYTFKFVGNDDDENKKELITLRDSAKYSGKLNLPVVVLNGEFLVRPEPEELVTLVMEVANKGEQRSDKGAMPVDRPAD